MSTVPQQHGSNCSAGALATAARVAGFRASRKHVNGVMALAMDISKAGDTGSSARKVRQAHACQMVLFAH